MFHPCITIYLMGWIIGSVGAFVVSEQVRAPGSPAPSRAVLSVAAGFLWPVLLLGAAELGSIGALVRLTRRRDTPVVDVLEKYFPQPRDC